MPNFLANPCPCGWSATELSETEKACDKCGRRWAKESYGWTQSTPPREVRDVRLCRHGREPDETCPHCPYCHACEGKGFIDTYSPVTGHDTEECTCEAGRHRST